MELSLDTWEGEGGFASPDTPMTGSESQIEWAERIKVTVGAEFDRVAAAFLGVARKQQGQAQIDTQAVIAILEEKRNEVMAQTRAGYFIHDWQELRDQVRQMIAHDARYQSIRARRGL